MSVVSPPPPHTHEHTHTQSPPYTPRDGAGFGEARVSRGVIERCEGEGSEGCVAGHINEY